MHDKYATEITFITLLGSLDTNFPITEGGNCFGIKTTDGGEYKVLNFYHENLKELLKRGLTWPIKIKTVEKHLAVINDPRIADNWYRDRFCETCCPRQFLPLPQQFLLERKIGRGEMVERSAVSPTGKTMTYEEYVCIKCPENGIYTIPYNKGAELDKGYIYAPYIPIMCKVVKQKRKGKR